MRLRVVCFSVIVLLLQLCWIMAAVAAPQPNVIVVITDDQGYGDLSFHGNPVVKTPHLDSLARQSVRLTDFHVAPMCTPTRGQLMCGQDALRNRAMNVSSGRTLLKRDLPTMASLLADAGYRTGIFGKWHLGDNYPYRPEDRGFQEALWFPSSHISSVPDYWDNDYFDDVYLHNGVREQQRGYCTDVFFTKAMEWIKPAGESGKPFFAYIPLNAPHGPLFVPDKYREEIGKGLPSAVLKLPNLDANQQRELISFLAMITNIDENIGRLLSFLDEQKLAENTIVIFLTDNGSTMGPVYFNAGMRGGKTTLWEGGHRVPCFVRWPGGDLGQPRAVDELTQVQDLLPTLLDLCKVSPRQETRFDGVSLAGLLRGSQESLQDRMLVINYSRMPTPDDKVPQSIPRKDGAAVLWKRWRLLHGKQLYDLAADPAQKADIADKHPDIAAKMSAHLDQWWDELELDVKKSERVVIGNARENPAVLSACEWFDVFVDQQRQVRRGAPRNGVWHLEVDHDGMYDFELRRWPAETGLTLTASLPVTKVTDGEYVAGKPLPIAAARLQIGGQQITKAAPEGTLAVNFRVDLRKGPCELRTTFLDADGQALCGAYYVTVKAEPAN